MANTFRLILDTLGPQGTTLQIGTGSPYSTVRLVTLAVATTDTTTTGYTMRIWGDVDTSFNADIQTDLSSSRNIAFVTNPQIQLSAGDGLKTIYVRIYDDVMNPGAIVSASVTLDQTLPTITITGPDVNKISKVSGKDMAYINFTVDSGFDEFKVCVVQSEGAAYNDANTVQIPNLSNNSSNVYGNAGGYPASVPISVGVNGVDLEAASIGDGEKILKVFVRDAAGNWSI